MKKKISGVLLTVSLISSTLGGCGKDIPSESQDTIIPEITDTTEVIETLAPIQATEDDTTKPYTRAEFDFVKAVESTYICGQKLSYPLTWGQFGKDFTLVPEEASISKEKKHVTTYVKYKGYYVGIFGFVGCDSVDAINEDTIIRSISVENNDMDFFGTSKITVNGLSISADHSQLFEALGDSFREGVGYQQIIYENDIGQYRFTFDFDDNLITIGLNVLY